MKLDYTAKTVSLASLTPCIVDHLAALFRRGALIKRIHRFISFTGSQFYEHSSTISISFRILIRISMDYQKATNILPEFYYFSNFFFLDITQDKSHRCTF